MNVQPKKIRSINKFVPAINSKMQHIRHQSMNLPLGTPTQSKRPFGKDISNDKSHSQSNVGPISARDSKNVNFKASIPSGININKQEENNKSLVLDANNSSFKINPPLKKFDTPNNVSAEKSISNNKSNKNINLVGTIKSKTYVFINIFLILWVKYYYVIYLYIFIFDAFLIFVCFYISVSINIMKIILNIAF